MTSRVSRVEDRGRETGGDGDRPAVGADRRRGAEDRVLDGVPHRRPGRPRCRSAGSMKVAATPSVPGPRYGPSWPARSSGRVGATTSRPGSTTAGSIGHPAVREPRMRRPEAAVGPDVPHDRLVSSPATVTRCSPAGVDLGHVRRRRRGPSRDSRCDQRPVAGSTSHSDDRRHASPDGGRPGPVRGEGDVPARCPRWSSELLHQRARPVEERDHAVVPQHARHRRTAPRLGRHRHVPRRGRHRAPGSPVARSTRAAPASVLLTPDDGASRSVVGEVRAQTRPPAVGREPAMPVSAHVAVDRSIRTQPPVTSRRLAPSGVRDEHVHQAAVRGEGIRDRVAAERVRRSAPSRIVPLAVDQPKPRAVLARAGETVTRVGGRGVGAARNVRPALRFRQRA